MAARTNSKTLVPSQKLVKVGNQVINLDEAVEFTGRRVRVVIASSTSDFKKRHREIANGVLIGTLNGIDGPLSFTTVNGESFEMSVGELLGCSITLKFDNFDVLEDLVEEMNERPLTANKGRAAELNVMIETSAAITQNQEDNGGIIAAVIGSEYSLNAVSLEKEVSSKDEALKTLKANLDKNRGIRAESIRKSRSMTQSAGVETPVATQAEAGLPPVVG